MGIPILSLVTYVLKESKDFLYRYEVLETNLNILIYEWLIIKYIKVFVYDFKGNILKNKM